MNVGGRVCEGREGGREREMKIGGVRLVIRMGWALGE
jgi:hypothetical protein